MHFANVQVTTGSVSGSLVTQAPTISNDTSISYHIRLAEPGDYYEFTVDAVNAGTIDAMIGEIHSTLNAVEITTLPSYLNYTVKYSDGVDVQSNHLLAANTIETYRIKIEYRTDIDPGDLPSSAQSLSLGFGINYIQATGSAVAVEHSIYVISDISVYLNQSLPSNLTIYRSPSDAMNIFGKSMFLRHVIQNGIVTESYVGFELNSQIYYLRGGGATYNSSTGNYNNDSIYYEANKQLLRSLIGEPTCEERGTDSSLIYYCGSPYFVGASPRGNVWKEQDSYVCNVSQLGKADCYFDNLG